MLSRNITITVTNHKKFQSESHLIVLLKSQSHLGHWTSQKTAKIIHFFLIVKGSGMSPIMGPCREWREHKELPDPSNVGCPHRQSLHRKDISHCQAGSDWAGGGNGCSPVPSSKSWQAQLTQHTEGKGPSLPNILPP